MHFLTRCRGFCIPSPLPHPQDLPRIVLELGAWYCHSLALNIS